MPILGSILTIALALQAVAPLPQAHAHNDYAQAKPLEGALAHGFCSIEADVFLVSGKILVGHDRKDLRPDRDLVGMYLKPLSERVRANGGSVYAKAQEVILLIDIKADGEKVYEKLREELKPYRSFLSDCTDGRVTKRAVTVILSGDRPIETVRKKRQRWVFIDGRSSDLGRSAPELIPLISDSWTTTISWFGQGEVPDEVRLKVRGMASQAHAKGQKLRFWATPETPTVWKLLVGEGVDLIGTDRQADLAAFLRSQD